MAEHCRIKPLPDAVVAQIKSSASITTLNSVVLRLLANSLDAGAKKIEISIERSRGSCIVEDDGLGILPCEFTESGGLGKLHQTSKSEKKGTVHGCDGVFIASLSAISLLTIVSRHSEYRSTNRITFHRSQVLSRLIPASESQERQLRGHGTRVTVRDLFGNMPVRVKHRAIQQQQATEVDREWDQLKLSILSFLICWPGAVGIKVLDVDGSRSMSLPTNTDILTENLFGLQKSSLSRFTELLVQAGYLSLRAEQIWIPASAASKAISIKGLIGQQPVANKQLQFLSIGIWPITPQSQYNELFDHINRLFKQSDFGLYVDDNETGQPSGAGSITQGSITFNARQKDLKASKKAIERYPIFSLCIAFRQTPADMQHRLQDSAHMEVILELLDALITGWLKTNHFRPGVRTPSRASARKRKQTGITGSPTTSRNTSPSPLSIESANRKYSSVGSNETHSKLGQGSRSLKTGDIEDSDFIPIAISRNDNPRRPSSTTMQMRQRPLSAAPALTNVAGSSTPAPRTAEDASQEPPERMEPDIDATMIWIDPITKRSHRVNSRTGTAVRVADPDQASRPVSRRLTMRPSTRESKSAPGWINGLLDTWQNPVFGSNEAGIPQLASAAEGTAPGNQRRLGGTSFAFEGASTSVATKLSKQSLQDATVLAQVDSRFILMLLPSGSGAQLATDLIMVDQHAADERCKVEQLLQELCQPSEMQEAGTGQFLVRHVELGAPLIFQIPANEAQNFQRQASHFGHWGINYDISDKLAVSDKEEKTLIVKTLPPTISERCKSEPSLLINFLRTEMWKTSEKATTLPITANASTAHRPSWLSLIGRCPTGILDMINSRACRSAIMFNDTLTHNECLQLTTELAKCAFPFQCAHGRPSMVPLVHLEEDSGSLLQWREEKSQGQSSFLKAFKNWKRKETENSG
ncbi:hypothetical protein BT63DRAFT_482576 [Microthyrium microscopicum]|uniref:MutL C-terminal dimerisation domain-containing protein n=1 Tax=Microthyrium microscopicum TaxID=703497 RepID=A0A6A6U1Z1_9PEZI|nr:hypothetical protein BT63DRAFT_482576 [Microthyrium microscopicum]